MLGGELAEDGAVADALRSDASAHRVEARFRGRDGDLGTEARLSRDRSHLDGAGLYLRHLRLEQPVHEHARRPRHADLRLAWVSLRIHDDHQHGTARMKLLARDLLLRRHDALCPAEVDIDGAAFDSIDDAAG